MVRIKQPLMSFEAHGQICENIVFSSNTWGFYAKFAPGQKLSGTVGQRAVRHAMGEVAEVWRLMSEEERRRYHTFAIRDGVTDYIYFFKEEWPLHYR